MYIDKEIATLVEKYGFTEYEAAGIKEAMVSYALAAMHDSAIQAETFYLSEKK